ncbi:AzlD domain-containing protein [Shouchella sp. JSM 1781072]|uniref:AzlD domain-containing protein n=1 Tax=Bacillaceae TaxID=186817 RepID=UPI0020D02B36|nr:AzlD domain-containing protein [Alkalihalobacillus sp. LMS6]UTR07181.1 AzlD domain-containing protein [Alkalihalobacillus sp. LMS6]
MTDQWLLIGLLAIIVFSIRFIGLNLLGNIKLNRTAELYFQYVPVAILTTLLMKQVLTIEKTSSTLISYPTLLVCLCTGLIFYFSKRFFLSVVIGVLAGVLTRTFF